MNHTLCSKCGKINLRQKSKYCSDNCRQRDKYKNKTSQVCLLCGKIARKLSNYCSNTCYKKDHYTPIVIKQECKFCLQPFASNIRKDFCSKKCSIAFRYKDRHSKGLCSCGKPLVTSFSACEVCRNNRKKYNSNKNRPLEQQLLNSAISRARNKKLPINITIEDIIIPEFCPVLKIRLEKGKGKSQANSPSLDRIIPSLGYVKNNIAIISHKANTIKQNATIEEVQQVLNYMKKYHKH